MEGYGDYLVAVKCGLGAWQMCPIVWRRCDGRGCGGSRSSSIVVERSIMLVQIVESNSRSRNSWRSTTRSRMVVQVAGCEVTAELTAV